MNLSDMREAAVEVSVFTAFANLRVDLVLLSFDFVLVILVNVNVLGEYQASKAVCGYGVHQNRKWKIQ
jgi:hypothetical protein